MALLSQLVSILLLAIFGLPFVSPLLASTTSGGETNLPACCRRGGKHHCMMGSVDHNPQLTDKPAFAAPAEKCPYNPAAFLNLGSSSAMALSTAQSIYAELVSHPAGTAQTESKLRIAESRSRQKRGPPSFSIAS